MASSDPNSAAPPRRSSQVRLFVLVGILAVAGLAAAWDYLYARPSHNRALEATKKFFPADDGPTDVATTELVEFYTPEEVHAELKLEPTSVATHGQYVIERYSWRSGAPWKTYDLFLVYSGDEEKTLFDRTTIKEEADKYLDTSVAPVRVGGGAPETADGGPALSGEASASEEPPAEATDDGAREPAGDEAPAGADSTETPAADAPSEEPSGETPPSDPAPAEAAEEAPAAEPSADAENEKP